MKNTGVLLSLIILVIAYGVTQSEVQFEVRPSYTSNYYYDHSQVDTFFVDSTALFSSVNGPWDFSLAVAKSWFPNTMAETAVVNEMTLLYTLPISINIDMVFAPVAYAVYYPDNNYSGIAYGAEVSIVYDSLIDFREEIKGTIYSDIRPDTPYDRIIMNAGLTSRWDISPVTVLRHSLMFSYVQWQELTNNDGLTPNTTVTATGLTIESILSDAVSGSISVSYEKNSSSVESILTVEDITLLETNSDSYTHILSELHIPLYLGNLMAEPYFLYAVTSYDSRRAFKSVSTLGIDTVHSTCVKTGLNFKESLGERHFITASVEYGLTDSNDFFEKGDGVTIQGGIVLNF